MPQFRALKRVVLVASTLLAGLAFCVRAQQSAPPPAPPASPVIARVENRPITQREYDVIAEPYFERLRAQLKDGYTEDIRKFARRNVLDELIRREVIAVESQRQKIPVSEAETDRLLRQDPFFLTNGKFDPNKFLQFKISTTSNYATVLPKLREVVAATKLDSMVRARSTPSPAAVRAEWSKRNEQVRFKFLSLSLRDISLEPEASEAEWAAYYAAHPDQFTRKPRVRLRYARLPLPPAGDSLRATRETEAMSRGRSMVDSLRAGTPIDTLAAPEGLGDTGLFDVPPAVIPGLGRVAELIGALAHADSDTTVRGVGPVVANDFVVVGAITERQPRTLPPMREILADVKRRADTEKRRVALEADRQAWYQSHLDAYRTPRARLTRVRIDDSRVSGVKDPRPVEVERWYAAHGREIVAPDTGTVGLPALNDSLRALARERMTSEARSAAAGRQVASVATGWQAGRDVRTLARSANATVETLTVYRDSLADAVFPPPLLDSLFSAATTGVQGPRRFGAETVLWRVDSVDSTHIRPFESVRSKVDQAFAQDKHAKDEVEGRAWFDAHQTDYKTRPKFVVDYIAVKVPPQDSVKVAEADVRKYYASHQDAYKREEEVRARHILLNVGAEGAPKAKARADSLRAALVAGADFADVARRFSQDPGSGSAGGDLGFFQRGRMVKEFSDTSFALPLGQISQPVKTQFGYHLIQVQERHPAGVRPFEEVQAEIRAQLAQSSGDSTASRKATALRRSLVRGTDPQIAARGAGGLISAGPFASSDPVPELGFVQGLAQDIEKLPVGKWAPKVYRASTAYVLIRPTKRVASAQADFAEVKTQATEDARNAKKKELLAQKVARIRADLAKGEPIDSVAVVYGGLKDSGLLNQASGFVPFVGPEPRLVSKAFAMKAGVLSDTLHTAQGMVWMRVEEKANAPGTSFAKDRAAILQELVQKKYGEWVEQKKKSIHVEILRADLREEPPLTKTVTVSTGGR